MSDGPFKKVRSLKAAVDYLKERGFVEAATALDSMIAGRGDPKPPSWSQEACDAWIERFGGACPGGRIGKALKPLVLKYGWLRVRPIWKRYLQQEDGRFTSAQDFAAKFLDHVRAAGRGQEVIQATRQEHANAAFNAVLRSAERGIVNNAQWWTEERVQELCGERAARAFMAAGGPSAFGALSDRSESFVRRDFVRAFLALE